MIGYVPGIDLPSSSIRVGQSDIPFLRLHDTVQLDLVILSSHSQDNEPWLYH